MNSGGQKAVLYTVFGNNVCTNGKQRSENIEKISGFKLNSYLWTLWTDIKVWPLLWPWGCGGHASTNIFVVWASTVSDIFGLLNCDVIVKNIYSALNCAIRD